MERKNILYAEDDELVGGLMLKVLNKLPSAKVEFFTNGRSLDERLQTESEGIDLVLTDNQMPYVLGSEIIKKYAKSPRFEKIPFVLCYGGFDKIGEEAVRNGAFAYIQKPISISSFLGIVNEALNFK